MGISDYGDPYHYVQRQSILAVVGLVALFVLMRVDYHVLSPWHCLAWLYPLSSWWPCFSLAKVLAGRLAGFVLAGLIFSHRSYLNWP